MSGAWWAVAHFVAGCLDPEEREAVVGDLEEAGANGFDACRAIVGLACRRLAQGWLHWSPWLALASVAVPAGFLLSFASRWWADQVAIDVFLYVENWTGWYLASPGARGDLIAAGMRACVLCAVLAAWSWTTGAALASASRRAQWSTFIVFGFVVFSATVGTTTSARAPHNAMVLATAFYGTVWPALLRATFVVLPAWFAVRRQRAAPLPWPQAAAVCVGASLLLIRMNAAVGAALTFGSNGALVAPDAGLDGIFGTVDDGHPVSWVVFVLMWPGLAMLASVTRQRVMARRAGP